MQMRLLSKMKHLNQYIKEVLGEAIQISPTRKKVLDGLPLYISETYRLYETSLFNHDLILVEHHQPDQISILQIQKHFSLLRKYLGKKVVLVTEDLSSFNRKRLIEKGINFIVPNKQLYIPDLLMDLKESFVRPKTKRQREKLIPTAQFLLIYHILDKYDEFNLEEHPFKLIAKQLGYSSMAISKAVENLKHHELISVEGGKEKFIRFHYNRLELWNVAREQSLWANPVLKRVFVDEKPQDLFLLKSNTSALPEYSEMNPSRQDYYAIEKTAFYALQRNKALINANEYEGRYCIEVWRYNPEILIEHITVDRPVVDPLSLYLSSIDSPDERIEMALEQILETYIW